MTGRGRATALAALLAWPCLAPAQSPPAVPAVPVAVQTPTDAGAARPPVAGAPGEPEPAIAVPTGDRNGREIFQRFRDGLSEPACTDGVDPRWRRHFAHVPAQFEGSAGGDLLPLFGYVVDALRLAHLPTEFALIPFVESGYRPGARSSSGPAGLWQFMARTGRNHQIPISATYDGRLSPVASTRAAVRYLKSLHGMFAGDWRLAVMAFNAGEYRVLAALKQHGQRAMDARAADLSSLTGITQAYVAKLHALSCLLAEAERDPRWVGATDRPVTRLAAVELPSGTVDLARWATAAGHDPARVARLNPAFQNGRTATVPGMRVLVPAVAAVPAAAAPALVPAMPVVPAVADPVQAATGAEPAAPAGSRGPRDGRTHLVVRGESAWTIARRHDISLQELLTRNALPADAVLHAGMRLAIDAPAATEPAMAN